MIHWSLLVRRWAMPMALATACSLPAMAVVPQGGMSAQASRADEPESQVPVPGLLNYLQGSVSLGNQPLNASSSGSVVLKPGQVLSTANGKAELLLTPGVYFRLGSDSAVKMVSPELTWTAVDLERGKAIVEVDEIYPQNNIQVYHAGVGIQLLKPGTYEFDAATSTVRVFQGEAAVRKPGDHWVVVKGGHQYQLQAELSEKPGKFDRQNFHGALYQWSGLRSQYLAEEARKSALADGYYGYSGWAFGPRWYGYGYGWGAPYWGWSMWRPFGWGWPGYYGGGVFYPYHGAPRFQGYRGHR